MYGVLKELTTDSLTLVCGMHRRIKNKDMTAAVPREIDKTNELTTSIGTNIGEAALQGRLKIALSVIGHSEANSVFNAALVTAGLTAYEITGVSMA